VGYGDKYPKNPHHRTAHASWKNALDTPTENRHILYGALVGGPNQDGTYEDDRQNYINNEVACDYNAGFTALLCKMTEAYGGTPDPDFPEPEKRDTEFYVETKLTEASGGVNLSLKFTNHSAWPARIESNMSYRYYMDLSEVIDAGYSPSDVVIRVDRDQAKMYDDYTPAEISPITQYKDNIYYIEVTYPDGRVAMPISEGQHQCELMLALVFPDYQSGWNAENDYSNADLLKHPEEYVITDRIPVYQNGVLISGVEPDGTKPTKPDTPDPAERGDVNADQSVTVADLVLLIRHLTGDTVLKKAQAVPADVDENSMVNGMDAACLRQMLAEQ
jgi:endoglucanase